MKHSPPWYGLYPSLRRAISIAAWMLVEVVFAVGDHTDRAGPGHSDTQDSHGFDAGVGLAVD